MAKTRTDCKSEEGITVGLIDSVISICRILATRDLSSPAVWEAIKDATCDEDVRKIVLPATVSMGHGQRLACSGCVKDGTREVPVSRVRKLGYYPHSPECVFAKAGEVD